MADKLILPGDLLGIEEEIGAINNTYVENGEVYSSVFGVKGGDARMVTIKPANKSLRKLKEKDLVYGKIIDLFDSVAMIEIEPEEGNERKVGETIGFLRITEIARGQGFIESFRDYMKIGDYLMARILEVTPTGTYLTIADDDLGIVKAHCSYCRTKLNSRGKFMQCPNCGSKEDRKMALKPGEKRMEPIGSSRSNDRRDAPRERSGGARRR